MRSSRNTVLLAGALLLAACSDATSPVVPTDGLAPDAPAALSLADMAVAAAADHHLVVFRGNGLPDDVAQRVEAAGGELVRRYDVVGAARVAGLGADGVAALLAARDIAFVEPEPYIEVPAPPTAPELLAVDVAASPESPADPTTAFFYARQWHLRAIQADMAWADGHLGSADVTVAILDTGIDYMYPDLQGRVDLSRSISLQPIDDLYAAFYFPTRHPITDLDFHGTHVASTVASNAYVNAGVTVNTTLIGVKVCSFYPGIGCSEIFQGIEHAVMSGANIINMSLGGAFQKKAYPGYVSVIARYANWARQNGALLVVSAGNDAIDLDRDLVPDDETDDIYHAPSLFKTYCSAPGVVCVSATGPTSRESVNGPWTDVDAFAPYSNYGRSSVDVAAPGGNAGGSVYAACSQTSLVIPVCQTGNYVVGASGTSMAAPHVSGVAALIMAAGTLAPSQVKATLMGTADDLGQPGTDPYYGKGRVNAREAVR